MVDRIVPRTTPADAAAVSAALGLHDAGPVLAEPFFDWAVEDRFAAGRPPWSDRLVRAVDDAAPWEQMKLRLVNGAHSQIAYLGAMAGWPTVDAAIAKPELPRTRWRCCATRWSPRCRRRCRPTAMPTARALLQRWRNPALAHRCQQIAMDGSQKIPQRWVRPLAERLANQQPIDRLALGVAALVPLPARRRRGGRGLPDRRSAGRHAARAAARAQAPGDVRAEARELLSLHAVFGPLTGNETLGRCAGHVAVVAARARRHGHAALAGRAGARGPRLTRPHTTSRKTATKRQPGVRRGRGSVRSMTSCAPAAEGCLEAPLRAPTSHRAGAVFDPRHRAASKRRCRMFLSAVRDEPPAFRSRHPPHAARPLQRGGLAVAGAVAGAGVRRARAAAPGHPRRAEDARRRRHPGRPVGLDGRGVPLRLLQHDPARRMAVRRGVAAAGGGAGVVRRRARRLRVARAGAAACPGASSRPGR